jgi:predicted ribosome-associated RNA-binding protein Tma20
VGDRSKNKKRPPMGRRERNKGVAIELAHYLGDGLYRTEEI